jgi:hypothetical protein
VNISTRNRYNNNGGGGRRRSTNTIDNNNHLHHRNLHFNTNCTPSMIRTVSTTTATTTTTSFNDDSKNIIYNILLASMAVTIGAVVATTSTPADNESSSSIKSTATSKTENTNTNQIISPIQYPLPLLHPPIISSGMMKSLAEPRRASSSAVKNSRRHSLNVMLTRMRSVTGRGLHEKYKVDWNTVLGEGAFGSVHPARLALTGEKVRSTCYVVCVCVCAFAIPKVIQTLATLSNNITNNVILISIVLM